MDIGDFIGVKGFVFRTQTGEISVHAQELTLLSKSLKPLPIVKYKDGVAYDKFDDPELGFRWWISGESFDKFYAKEVLQQKIDFDNQ